MSQINVKRFVDVNITREITKTTSGTRDVLVLFTPEGTSGQIKLVSSLSQALSLYSETDAPITRTYLSVYFNNGGAKCIVVEDTGYSDISNSSISELMSESVSNVVGMRVGDYNPLLFGCADSDLNVENVYSALKAICAASTATGVNEKVFFARSKVFTDTDSIKNFAVKYSTKLGAEMTIPAYLSRIDVYKTDSVNDYMFTQETVIPEVITDSDFETMMLNNYNVDINFANGSQNVQTLDTFDNVSRNLGGNMKNGLDIVNEFVRIILCQTLTAKLENLLVQKLKYASSISKIYSVIAQELEEYKRSGYLTNDKIWTDPDYVITYNSVEYLIVSQGTAITNGYLIKVLPFSALTSADKASHKAPPIYIVIADQYGIRKITIDGKVF